MTFISAISNPEGLCIYLADSETGDKRLATIEISWNAKSPHTRGEKMSVPYKVFITAVKKWHKSEQEELTIAVDGFKIEEVYVFQKTGELVVDDDYLFKKKQVITNYYVQLLYKDSFVRMWHVTWFYVVQNVIAN